MITNYKYYYIDILLIVESPAKAKKIKGFYKSKSIDVKSTYGHIYDLDRSKLSINIENNFKPNYIVLPDKRKVIKELKKGTYSTILLAADDDREGEAIAWHCTRLLNIPLDKNRIKFNEITKNAFDKAIKNPMQLDINMVNAQQARRIIDRLVGYKLSPLLWKHIQTDKKGLSAGRVQSCLLHMLKKHEVKINEYKPEKCYQLNGIFNDKIDVNFQFNNKNISKTEVKLLFNQFTISEMFSIKDYIQTKEKTYSLNPFITSTLQQQAQKDFGFKVSYTMSIAQKLYENGFITYMRTDSTYINIDFENKLQDFIHDKFGTEYYTKKKIKTIKGAQEAHEAIRPTQLTIRLPDSYNDNEIKLYSLIVKRTIQAYMSPAIYDVLTINFTNKDIDSYGYFQSKQKYLYFKGYLKYNTDSNDTLNRDVNLNTIPQSKYQLIKATASYQSTNPPQYYNESSIVKQLENNGIGRPSTYSNIINTVYSRKYTEIVVIPSKDIPVDTIQLKEGVVSEQICINKIPKQNNKILLTDLGKKVLTYLELHFSNIINCEFTSLVEKDLDDISVGKIDWIEVIRKVYNMFASTVIREMSTIDLNRSKNFIKSIQYNNEQLHIYKGPYGYYLSYNKRFINVSNYLKMMNSSIDTFNSDDISTIVTYPKKVCTHNKKDIYIHIGPYGYYLKYNNKNYKINQSIEWSKKYCLSII